MPSCPNIGSIHGRFQPFHNAHMAYALAALQHVDYLYVGLSRVLTEKGLGEGVVPHRFDSAENPLTYYERTNLIRSALLSQGVCQSRFDIGPFPIENPSRLLEFWPSDLTCFTTNISGWNETKIGTLRALGYNVVVLDLVQTPDFASGTQIRAMARAGDSEWRKFVPERVAEYLIAADVMNRE